MITSPEFRFELEELKARYFRYVDTKNWEAFQALFTSDAILRPLDDLPGVTFQSAAMISEAVAQSLSGVTSVHHGHTPEFAQLERNVIRGVWAMEDMLWFGADSSAPGIFMHGFGHYHETYCRIEGRWLFQSVELRRLKVEKRRS